MPTNDTTPARRSDPLMARLDLLIAQLRQEGLVEALHELHSSLADRCEDIEVAMGALDD